MAEPTTTQPTPRQSVPRRRGRLRAAARWTVRVMVVVAMLFIVAIVLATQTSVVGGRALPAIGDAVGLEVRADGAYIGWDGGLVIEGARFRLPAVDGPAGEVLSVERVRASIDWWRSLDGEPRVTTITLTRPVLIASQSLEDRSLNIGHLSLPAGAGGAEALPTIIATDGRIELGEHLGTRYTPLKVIRIDGRFAPAADAPAGKPAYDLTLTQLMPGERSAARAEAPAGAAAPGFSVSGTFSDERIALTVENFSLDNWPAESVPSPVRGFFRDLYLQGNVPRAAFTYTDKDGITARLDLRGVAMNLPLEPDFGPPAPGAPVMFGPPPKYMRLYDTEGTITFARESVLAQVKGRLEDMPYRVTWFHQGITPDAPFTCDFVSDDFRIDASPALLPYAPPVVAERLQDFSSPTARVTARMTIQRGQPAGDEPGVITVNGSVDLREGVAAFEGFPYQFQDITGTFDFNSDKIEFRNVTGRSPSGAVVRAHGLIAPLDEDAQVDVTVEMQGAPIDDAVAQAFGPRHRDLIPALFNRERYRALIEAGLVRTSAVAREEDQELRGLRAARTAGGLDAAGAARATELERRAGVPQFDLGGIADVTVNVHRPYGFETDWQTTVDIRLPRVGMLPEAFPLPVIGSDVAVHIEDTDGQLMGGRFEALGGGSAEVTANFSVPLAGDKPTRTSIGIAARDLPVSPLLIHALPGDDDAEHKRILRRLNIGGLASGTVRIADRAPSEEADGRENPLGFDVDFTMTDGSLSPVADGDGRAFTLGGIGAQFQMNERRLLMDFTARAPGAGGEADKPGAIEDGSGGIFGRVRADFDGWGEEASASYDASLHWPDLPLELPVESLVAAISPDAAQEIADARAAFNPAGLLSAHVNVRSSAAGPALEVEFDEIRSASADLLGRRIELREAIGAIGISAAAGGEAQAGGAGASPALRPIAKFDNFQAEFLYNGERAGVLQLDGEWPLESDDGPAPATASSLVVALRDAPLESAFLRTLLADQLGPDLLERIGELGPRGILDAQTMLRPGAEGPEWDVLRIEPRSLAFAMPDAEVRLSDMSGTVEIERGGGGVARQLRAAADDWSILADAAWSSSRSDGLSVRGEFELSGRRLSPDLLAVLPAELRGLLAGLELSIEGPFQLDDGRLDFTRDTRGRIGSFEFTGDVRFRDASLEVGFPLAELTGRVEARASRIGPDGVPEFTLDIRADSLLAAGISMTDATATVRSGERPGEILVRSASGDVHEGRLSAEATIAPPQSPLAPFANVPIFGPPAPDRRAFTATARLAGIRFSPLLDELAVSPRDALDSPAVLPPDPSEAPINEMLEGVGSVRPDSPEAGDLSRGALDGQVSLSGIIGDVRSRRGQGSLRIFGGRILNLPVVLALIEVSNLALPVNARLDYAVADFYIDGGLIVFNDLSAHSAVLHIFGSGTMTWPGRLLDLRFDSRASRPVPVLSQLLAGIRDELVTTTVRGPLGEHEVRLRQLPRSRRILSSAARQIPLLPPEEPDEIRQRSQDGRQRGGDFGPGIAPTPPRRGDAQPPPGPARSEARPN